MLQGLERHGTKITFICGAIVWGQETRGDCGSVTEPLHEEMGYSITHPSLYTELLP